MDWSGVPCEERIQWHAQQYVLTGTLTIRCARLCGPFNRLTFGGCLEEGKSGNGGRLKKLRRKEEVQEERREQQQHAPLSPPWTPPGTIITKRMRLKRILKSRAMWTLKHHKECLRKLVRKHINAGPPETMRTSHADAIEVDTATRISTTNKFLFSSSPPMDHADENDVGDGDLMGNISNFVEETSWDLRREVRNSLDISHHHSDGCAALTELNKR